MTYYVGAMRSANMATQTGTPVAYFDDVSGGTFWPNCGHGPAAHIAANQSERLCPKPVVSRAGRIALYDPEGPLRPFGSLRWGREREIELAQYIETLQFRPG
jgi:hypothetical protein